jgi:hypothetical protein
MKIIYAALSKKIFYHRFSISKFILNSNAVPINPFMNFDYYLGEGIEREKIRQANNLLAGRCDELWVFGEISNGIRREIEIAEKNGKAIRYFLIDEDANVKEIDKKETKFEN